jgi:hypothetical protein
MKLPIGTETVPDRLRDAGEPLEKKLQALITGAGSVNR